jgi:hypothetical protein
MLQANGPSFLKTRISGSQSEERAVKSILHSMEFSTAEAEIQICAIALELSSHIHGFYQISMM